VSLAHINLARLDLDTASWASAANHLGQALDLLDPDADRWVLVEAIEAVARLIVADGLPGAGELLDCSAAIRSEIDQPVAPTELYDLETTLARSRLDGDDHGPPLWTLGTSPGCTAAASG